MPSVNTTVSNFAYIDRLPRTCEMTAINSDRSLSRTWFNRPSVHIAVVASGHLGCTKRLTVAGLEKDRFAGENSKCARGGGGGPQKIDRKGRWPVGKGGRWGSSDYIADPSQSYNMADVNARSAICTGVFCYCFLFLFLFVQGELTLVMDEETNTKVSKQTIMII